MIDQIKISFQDLESLYASKIKLGLIDELKNLEALEKDERPPANPLFININEVEFRNATIRIMFFGQETNSWGNTIKATWKNSQELYKTFFYETMKQGKYNGSFWPSMRKLKSRLETNILNTKIEFVWNNIYKIGNQKQNLNCPTEKIRNIENKYFDIINEEINILKPNVLLFFTGPNYEYRLKEVFGQFIDIHLSPNIEKSRLARLNLSNNILDYRTYHPRPLRQKKIFDEYINLIIEDILKHMNDFQPIKG